jgi:nucleotide-binding universal stress UspA family protein
MYRTIIWATDGSDGADRALVEARALAHLCGARIVAAHCDVRLTGRAGEWPILPDEDDRRAKIREQVADLRACGVDIDLKVRRSDRDAATVIAEIALEHHGDLIVCGTRGLGALHGSFTRRLVHVAPCPVLAVPEPAGRRGPPTPARAAAHA